MRKRMLSVLTSIAIWAARPPPWRAGLALPTIHRVTIDSQSGVLTITGAGLGPELVVSVEGTSVPSSPARPTPRLKSRYRPRS